MLPLHQGVEPILFMCMFSFVPREGVEPSILSEPDPNSGASTSFAIKAYGEFYSAGFSEPPHLTSHRFIACSAQIGTVKRRPKAFRTTCFRRFHGTSARGFTSCGPDENRTRHDLPAREFRLPWYMPAHINSRRNYPVKP